MGLGWIIDREAMTNDKWQKETGFLRLDNGEPGFYVVEIYFSDTFNPAISFA
jgi:hypothetical protein